MSSQVGTVPITLVVPVYNCAHRVDDLLTTLFALSPQPAQCVLCDDGSLDGTVSVVQAKIAGREGYSVRTHPNGGPASARNLGIEAAIQPWVAFTDDDCQPTPDWLGAMQAAIQAHPDTPCFFGRIEAIGEKTPLHHYVENDGEGHQTANAAYRLDLLKQLGGFDTAFPFPYLEDTELFLRVSEFGPSRFVKEALVRHPCIPASLKSRIRRMRYYESDYVFFKKHPQTYRRRHRGRGPLGYHLYYLGLKHGLKAGAAAVLEAAVSPSQASRILTGLILERVYLSYLTLGWYRLYR